MVEDKAYTIIFSEYLDPDNKEVNIGIYFKTF